MVHTDNNYRIRWVNAVFLWLSKVDTWSPMPCIAMVRIKHFVRTLSNVLIEFALFEMILTLNDSFKNKNYIFQWFIEPNSLQRAKNNHIKDVFFFIPQVHLYGKSHAYEYFKVMVSTLCCQGPWNVMQWIKKWSDWLFDSVMKRSSHIWLMMKIPRNMNSHFYSNNVDSRFDNSLTFSLLDT